MQNRVGTVRPNGRKGSKTRAARHRFGGTQDAAKEILAACCDVNAPALSLDLLMRVSQQRRHLGTSHCGGGTGILPPQMR
jgi:hypothetical protein